MVSMYEVFRSGEQDYLDSAGYGCVQYLSTNPYRALDYYAMGYEYRSMMTELVTERMKLLMTNGDSICLTHPLWGNK